MPPKAKITKEMIVDAAFEIARTEGAERINARTVSQRLGCSTQPVMYHFAKIEDMKKAVYVKADRYHTDYITNVENMQGGMLRGIGLRYIRFAIEEKHLFRFLFQSNLVSGNSLAEIIDAEEAEPVIAMMQKSLGMDVGQTKKVFLILSMFAHGYASMIANNSIKYDETVIESHLEQAYRGAILAVKEEME